MHSEPSHSVNRASSFPPIPPPERELMKTTSEFFSFASGAATGAKPIGSLVRAGAEPDCSAFDEVAEACKTTEALSTAASSPGSGRSAALDELPPHCDDTERRLLYEIRCCTVMKI